jgi:hypothetical protein
MRGLEMSDETGWQRRDTCHVRECDGGGKARISDESGFIFIGGGGGSGRGCLFWILLSIGLSVLLTVGVNLLLLAF